MKRNFENSYILKGFTRRLALVVLLLPVGIAFLQNNALADPICTNCSIPLPPAPSEWKVNGNGYLGILIITSQVNGNIKGTIYGQQIFGFYDVVSGKITFLREIDPSNPFTFQVWTGYVFEDKPVSGIPKWTFDGYFQAFQSAGGITERHIFGWQAETQQQGQAPDTTIISANDTRTPPNDYLHKIPQPVFRPEGNNHLIIIFTGTSTKGISGFQCSLNGAAFSPCTSPISYGLPPILDQAYNTFQVRAVDKAGNIDPTPATLTFYAAFG